MANTGQALRAELDPWHPVELDPWAPHVTFGVGRTTAQVVETLTARGVRFPCGVVDDGPVKLACFADVDGNEMYPCEYQGGG